MFLLLLIAIVIAAVDIMYCDGAVAVATDIFTASNIFVAASAALRGF